MCGVEGELGALPAVQGEAPEPVRVGGAERGRDGAGDDGERFVCNEEEGEGVQAKNEIKEMIGDLYLDTQVIAVCVESGWLKCRFGRSKALLVQFIIFYMSYIRSIHSPNDRSLSLILPHTQPYSGPAFPGSSCSPGSS